MWFYWKEAVWYAVMQILSAIIHPVLWFSVPGCPVVVAILESVLLLLYWILHSTLSDTIKKTTVWRERVQGVSSELHSCGVDGFVTSCCLSFLPSIDPPLHFITAVFCCSNSFNSPQPKWQLCQENGSKQYCHSDNLVYYICCIH